MKFLSILALFCITACAAPPRQELQTARLAIGRAYYAGAEELAPEEYRRAADTLRKGEELIRKKRFQEARTLLPAAESQAREAMAKARIERDRLERLRLEENADLPAFTPQMHTAKRSPLPSPSPPVPPKPRPSPPLPPALPSRYTVGENETLWTIASRDEVYGDPLLWPLLYQANRDQIRDPRRLYRGQVLSIPRSLSPKDLEEARDKAKRSDIFPPDRARSSGARTS